MRILQWRVPQKRTPGLVKFPLRAVRPPVAGDYAGRARFQPRDTSALPPELQQAIGLTIDVELAGIARRDEPFAGQHLYRECCGNTALADVWIPEQDLEFVD